MNRRQFFVAIAAVAIAAVAAAIVFFVLTGKGSGDDEGQVVKTIELSSDQTAGLESVATSFLQESSNFGVNLDSITSETASQRMSDIANDNGGTSWIKRTDVAGRSVSKYVDLSGGFRFFLERIAEADWTDGTNVASFKSQSMEVSTKKSASYVFTDRDQPILLAEVSFTGKSTLSYFAQSPDAVHTHSSSSQEENHDVEFTPWDIREQSIPVEGKLTMVQEEEGGPWKVRELSFSKGEFALPYWTPAANTSSYPDTKLDGTLVKTIDFPNGTGGN